MSELDKEKTSPEPQDDASLEAGPPDTTGEGKEQEHDENIVWWDEPVDQDPMNPMNWTEKKKWANIAVLSAMTFVTPLASSMFAPGVPEVLKTFHSSSETLAEFVVSVYILGFAFGPLIIAPLSEMFGRVWVYNVTNVGFVIFNLACSFAPSFGALIVFRFLAGCFGSTPVTIGGGTIADMMPVERRAGAMAIWALGPLIGPVVGPVTGGFLVDATSWRFVFRLLTIIGGVTSILCFFCMKESYAPYLLERKAMRLRKETGNPNLRSKLDTGLSKKDMLFRSIVRPTKMLLFSPIVALFSVFIGICYGMLYLLFTTFTFVFEEGYGFSSGTAGLTFIGIGLGMLLGLGMMGFLSDKIIKQVQARGETPTPEHRIPIHLTVPSTLSISFGLFIYGWTAQYHVHWIVPIIGTFFVGIGLMGVFMTINVYLVDAFVQYAASAMAANTVLRSTFGAFLPLAGLDMYKALGLGWGNSLLAFVILAMAPVCVLFAKYGQRIRTHPKFQLNL